MIFCVKWVQEQSELCLKWVPIALSILWSRMIKQNETFFKENSFNGYIDVLIKKKEVFQVVLFFFFHSTSFTSHRFFLTFTALCLINLELGWRLGEWNQRKEAQATFQKAKEFKIIPRTSVSFDTTEVARSQIHQHTVVRKSIRDKATCKIYEV